MAIQNPYNQNFNSPNQSTAVPQSYVNINTQTPLPAYQQGVFTKFVSSDQEAFSNIMAPQNGCSFGVDGEHMVFYAKYADGHMEIYDMIQREPPKQPEPLTADSLSALLDQKFNDFENALSKKFVLRKDNYTRGGNTNA